jgi:cytidylate kinase
MNRQRPIIAIDGPVGAGKSSVARGLARALGFSYINTGAMYRALAIAARSAGISPEDERVEARLAPILRSVEIKFDGERVMLNGRDVSIELGDPEISNLASRFSALADVRARMRDLQRAAGAGGGVVMEGRDIGTVIFPDAEFKFFLVADIAERARRRYRELRANGSNAVLEEVTRALVERDRRDTARELAPLRRAPGAIEIDSTAMTIEQEIAAMRSEIERGVNARKGLKHG